MIRFTHYKIRDKKLIEMIMKLMGLGTGISVGIVAKNVACSICGKNYRNCEHIQNETYDGKIAHRVVTDMEVDHVSIVERPKIPGCGIEVLILPKRIVEKYLINYVNLGELELDNKEDNPDGIFFEGIAFKAN